MGYLDQYPALVAALVKTRGSFGAVDSLNAPLPALTAPDMSALLVLVFEGIKNGVKAKCDLIAPVSKCDDSGVISDISQAATWLLSVDAYLAGAAGPVGHQRSAPDAFYAADGILSEHGLWQPALTANLIKGEETNILALAWQTVDDYQACLVAGAQAFMLYGSAPVATDMGQIFLRAFRALCADIDTLGEAAPVSLADALKGATAAALNASARTAGELAAGIGNAAGTVAGSLLGGFLGNANVVTLALAGVVLYKVV